MKLRRLRRVPGARVICIGMHRAARWPKLTTWDDLQGVLMNVRSCQDGGRVPCENEPSEIARRALSSPPPITLPINEEDVDAMGGCEPWAPSRSWFPPRHKGRHNRAARPGEDVPRQGSSRPASRTRLDVGYRCVSLRKIADTRFVVCVSAYTAPGLLSHRYQSITYYKIIDR